MINNNLVLDSKIGNEVHNASYPTHYPKKEKRAVTAQCTLYCVYIDMAQNVIFYAPLTTLHIAFQKQAELIVYLQINLQLLCNLRSQRHKCFYQAQRDCSTPSSDIIYNFNSVPNCKWANFKSWIHDYKYSSRKTCCLYK